MPDSGTVEPEGLLSCQYLGCCMRSQSITNVSLTNLFLWQVSKSSCSCQNVSLSWLNCASVPRLHVGTLYCANMRFVGIAAPLNGIMLRSLQVGWGNPYQRSWAGWFKYAHSDLLLHLDSLNWPANLGVCGLLDYSLQFFLVWWWPCMCTAASIAQVVVMVGNLAGDSVATGIWLLSWALPH